METTTIESSKLNGNGHAEAALAPASLHPRAILTKQALDLETEQRKLLQEYVARHMVKGVDYGEIPGTDKPTLLKPGAEKLVDLFRCTPKFKLLKVEEDFDRGHGFFNYVFRVQLVQRDVGAVVAEGFGSANSREGRYRWRNANRKCPKCTKETLFQSKNKPEFYCWSKRGGCGATFPLNDKSITEQVVGKVENEDVATLANTILKMAKKRALVDGSIALARCSDMFTQDVEDFAGHEPDSAAAPESKTEKQDEKPASSPKTAPKNESAKEAKAPESKPEEKSKPAPRSQDDVERQVLDARGMRIWNRAKEAGVTREEFGSWYPKILGTKRPHTQWTKEDCDQLDACLPELIQSKKAEG